MHVSRYRASREPAISFQNPVLFRRSLGEDFLAVGSMVVPEVAVYRGEHRLCCIAAASVVCVRQEMSVCLE